MADKKINSINLFISMIITLLPSFRALGDDNRFPFEVTEQIQVLDEYCFREIDFSDERTSRSEVLVTTSSGEIIFPLDTKYSQDFNKKLFKKIINSKLNEDTMDKSHQLVLTITPSIPFRISIFPEYKVSADYLDSAAEYLGLKKEEFDKMLLKFRQEAEKSQAKKSSNGVKIITIMTGNIIRKFEIILSENSDELVSINILEIVTLNIP
jgi:hypothetical protein